MGSCKRHAADDALPRIDGRRARGHATRTAILHSASDLFAAQGYSASSMSAIAVHAGVKTASIHHAFGSKEQLLAAVIENLKNDMFQRIGEIVAAGDTPDEQRAAAVMQLLVKHPRFLRLFLLLTLERQEGDPAILATVEQIRTQARTIVASAIAHRVEAAPPAKRPELLDQFGRLTLIMLDGTFLSHQIDGEAVHGSSTVALVTATLQGALDRMVEQAVQDA